jgi:TonB family protein
MPPRYVVRSFLIFAFLPALCMAQLRTQKSTKKISKGPSFSKNSLTDAKPFFVFFSSMKEDPKRGEFETESEYRTRMSKKADTSSTVLLAVTVPPANETKNYWYDINNNRLTFGGGIPQVYECASYKPSNGTPIIIEIGNQDMGSYVATNAFGKPVTVQKNYVFDYAINFTNLSFVPDSIFDRQINSFFLSIYRPPKQAEKLSKSVIIAIGVKPISYQQSNFECVYTQSPKIDDPYEIAKFNYSFDARLTRIFLYDQSTKKVVANYNVNEDSSIILSRNIKTITEETKEPEKQLSVPNTDNTTPPDFVSYDTEPVAQHKVDAQYPEIANRTHLEGNVFLKLWVDTKGVVREAVVLKSDAEIFNQAAIDAAKQWIFKPAYAQGKPVAVWFSLPFRFRLPN